LDTMTKTPSTGRPSIFRGKNLKKTIRAAMTDVGLSKFEAARARLAKLTGWKPGDISDGDTAEYLARGHEDTVKYLKGLGKQ